MTTEEIVVSGENFIERRIFVQPEQTDLDYLQQFAYQYGYKRGWTTGFLIAFALFSAFAVCVWLAVQW